MAPMMLAIPAAIGPTATRKMGLPEKNVPKLMSKPIERSAMPFPIDGFAMAASGGVSSGSV